MNTNENIRTDMQEDVIVLGVASVETKGGTGQSEANGFPVTGISEGGPRGRAEGPPPPAGKRR
jgi:hypothetical protein